jgi:putative glutamine amidotransferase
MRNTKTGPIIGISMCWDRRLVRPGVDYSILRREYGQSVMAAGGQPIYLDSSIHPEVAASLCDGIIISGGEDMEPELYGQERQTDFPLEPFGRTLWEQHLIDACDARGIHILGVCYGLQLLNVHYGGTLHQDITGEEGSGLYHGDSGASSMQRVRFNEAFLSFDAGDSVETAHRHHQAIDRVAAGFRVAAATDDGTVEAIAGHGHYGVQWHAESDGTAPAIYGAFVSLCAGADASQPRLNPVPENA